MKIWGSSVVEHVGSAFEKVFGGLMGPMWAPKSLPQGLARDADGVARRGKKMEGKGWNRMDREGKRKEREGQKKGKGIGCCFQDLGLLGTMPA